MLRHVSGFLSLFFILIPLALNSCNTEESGSSVPAEVIPEFEVKKGQIEGMQPEDYEVIQVQDEGGVIRVDVSLHSSSTGGELKRMVLNMLHEIQAVIGSDDRLAVWAHDSHDELQAMAFYSPLTETYHYKTADELN